MSYIVLDRNFLNKPMILLGYDGNKTIKDPRGCLFICRPEDKPTAFENKRKAAGAIKSSMKWRGETDAERYFVIDYGSWEEAVQPRPRVKGKKRAKANG